MRYRLPSIPKPLVVWVQAAGIVAFLFLLKVIILKSPDDSIRAVLHNTHSLEMFVTPCGPGLLLEKDQEAHPILSEMRKGPLRATHAPSGRCDLGIVIFDSDDRAMELRYYSASGIIGYSPRGEYYYVTPSARQVIDVALLNSGTSAHPAPCGTDEIYFAP